MPELASGLRGRVVGTPPALDTVAGPPACGAGGERDNGVRRCDLIPAAGTSSRLTAGAGTAGRRLPAEMWEQQAAAGVAGESQEQPSTLTFRAIRPKE